MSETKFDDLTDVYEAMIDWPKRLGAEAPFFRRQFEQSNVKRVADIACGTGRHAAMFHSWGLEVEGSDVSSNMIQCAKENFGAPDGLRWAVRNFEQPLGPPASFDAVICVGNSLALAPDAPTTGRVLRHMFTATRPGGVVIVHVLNLWKFPQGPCVWQKLTQKTSAQGRSLILKGVHRCQDEGYVELAVIADDAHEPLGRSHSMRFLGIRAKQLEAAARDNAAVRVLLFGGHQDQPYDADNSPDLIMVAWKGQAGTAVPFKASN
jgi:SAM-dependent methyltransferase